MGATGVLLNVTGGADLGLLEINEAAEIVQDAADPDANIIFGAVIDENLKDEIRITVIATGFEVDNKSVVKKPESVVITNDISKSVIEAAITEDLGGSDLEIPAFLRRHSSRK